jgi:hypothetical protein
MHRLPSRCVYALALVILFGLNSSICATQYVSACCNGQDWAPCGDATCVPGGTCYIISMYDYVNGIGCEKAPPTNMEKDSPPGGVNKGKVLLATRNNGKTWEICDETAFDGNNTGWEVIPRGNMHGDAVSVKPLSGFVAAVYHQKNANDMSPTGWAKITKANLAEGLSGGGEHKMRIIPMGWIGTSTHWPN